MPASRRPREHQAAHADIGPAGLRIDHEVDRGGDVGAPSAPCPRWTGSVVRSASSPVQHDLLHRRLGARDIEHVGLVAQPPQQLRQELVRLDPEGARDPRAAAGDVADELLALGTDRAKQHRLGIAFEDSRDIGEVGRLAARSRAHRPALRRSGAGGSDRHRPASTGPRRASFQRCPFLRCPVAVIGAVHYSETPGCDHKR